MRFRGGYLFKISDALHILRLKKNLWLEMEKKNLLHLKYINNNTIDLHGMIESELKVYLKHNLKKFKNSEYILICGRGLHSDGDPILKKIIINFCNDYKINCSIESKGGSIRLNKQKSVNFNIGRIVKMPLIPFGLKIYDLSKIQFGYNEMQMKEIRKSYTSLMV